MHGQSVTFTATVSSTGGNAPTGTVWFKDGKNGIGTAILSGGSAVFTKSDPLVGSRNVTAEYKGNATSAPSTSAILVQVVNPR
ncbi:MAG: Ig-like domain-containing protein [Terriglobales bacterium]